MRLGDIVEKWLDDNRLLRGHLAIEQVHDGFFVNMQCARPDGPEPTSIMFVNDTKRDIGWLHGMDPHDPDYFVKLEEMMITCHNRLHDCVGCGVVL